MPVIFFTSLLPATSSFLFFSPQELSFFLRIKRSLGDIENVGRVGEVGPAIFNILEFLLNLGERRRTSRNSDWFTPTLNNNSRNTFGRLDFEKQTNFRLVRPDFDFLILQSLNFAFQLENVLKLTQRGARENSQRASFFDKIESDKLASSAKLVKLSD